MRFTIFSLKVLHLRLLNKYIWHECRISSVPNPDSQSMHNLCVPVARRRISRLGCSSSSGAHAYISHAQRMHYWKRVLCRGPEALPRAKSRALGKDTLCRGPATGALGKERPSAKRPLPRVQPSAKTGPRQIKSLPRAAALGKDALGKLGPLGHGGQIPSSFAEGHPLGPRQRFFFCETSFFGKFFLSLCRGP